MTDNPSGSIERAADRLARPAWAPLVDALARRYGQAADIEPVRVQLRGLPAETRRALADLLGSDRLPAADVQVRVERVTAALGLADPPSLRTVVSLLRGPLGDQRALRAAVVQERDELWTWFAAAAADLDLGPHALNGWVATVRAGGIRGGVPAFRARLQAALQVLRALPADGVPLPAFASDHAGDPHALDHGRALAGLVLDAVACAAGQLRLGDAETARTWWESVGVVPDPCSSTVLTLGLAGHTGTPLGRWLTSAAAVGEPVVLTLANLRRWPVPPLPSTDRLYVVENPSLLVEASASKWPGPPLVCSSGRPSVAVVTLLRQLTAAGARAPQHADLDPAGLAITQWLASRAGTTPWRMDAADYAEHAGTGPATIEGSVPPTPWDPLLQQVMADRRRPVYEEQVRAGLLAAMRP